MRVRMPDAAIAAIFVILVAALGLLVWSARHSADNRGRCERAGGVYMQIHGHQVCFRKEAFMPVREP